MFVDKTTFAVGENARMVLDEMIFDPGSNNVSSVTSLLQGAFVIITGEIGKLSPESVVINTPAAQIGIRGTGIYLEVYPERNYVCLCYGRAVLKSKLEPRVREALNTTHHEGPRNFHADPKARGTKFIEKAKMVNHKDTELIMLEALVGRIPKFGDKPIKMPEGSYGKN